MEPLEARLTAGELSLRTEKVRSRASTDCTRTSWWATTPVSSKSLMVRSPSGLRSVTRRAWMEGGKRARQSNGGESSMNQMPPMPGRAASTAPMPEGESGTNSASRVGRVCKSRARASKSSSWARTCRSIRTRCRSEWRMPVCKVLKRPRPPGMARTMLRSSPKTFCQAFKETRRAPRRSSKIVHNRA